MRQSFQVSKVTSKVKQAYYSGRVYSDCSELPYFNFIKLAVTGQLQWLVKSGRVDPITLPSLWESIQEEYQEIDQSEEALAHLDTLREIYEINGRLIIIEAVVKALSTGVGGLKQQFINNLRESGFRFKYTNETMADDLKKTISQAKTLKVRLDQLQAELPKGDGKIATEQDYYDQVSAIEYGLKHPIDIRNISTSEFISKLALFKKLNTPKADGITRED